MYLTPQIKRAMYFLYWLLTKKTKLTIPVKEQILKFDFTVDDSVLD